MILSNPSDEIPPKTNWKFWPRSGRLDYFKIYINYILLNWFNFFVKDFEILLYSPLSSFDERHEILFFIFFPIAIPKKKLILFVILAFYYVILFLKFKVSVFLLIFFCFRGCDLGLEIKIDPT
jgi:hypothetical protein